MGYQIMHNEKARLAAENAALENQGEMQRRRAECVTNMAERIEQLEAKNERLKEELAAAQLDAASKQANIDSLMLEYCPNEMTPEQMVEWEKHQQPISEEEQAAIEKGEA